MRCRVAGDNIFVEGDDRVGRVTPRQNLSDRSWILESPEKRSPPNSDDLYLWVVPHGTRVLCKKTLVTFTVKCCVGAGPDEEESCHLPQSKLKILLQ